MPGVENGVQWAVSPLYTVYDQYGPCTAPSGNTGLQGPMALLTLVYWSTGPMALLTSVMTLAWPRGLSVSNDSGLAPWPRGPVY